MPCVRRLIAHLRASQASGVLAPSSSTPTPTRHVWPQVAFEQLSTETVDLLEKAFLDAWNEDGCLAREWSDEQFARALGPVVESIAADAKRASESTALSRPAVNRLHAFWHNAFSRRSAGEFERSCADC